ncbi:MAG: hypothetical protein QM784_36050 [Polyangiaceae bacterium]
MMHSIDASVLPYRSHTRLGWSLVFVGLCLLASLPIHRRDCTISASSHRSSHRPDRAIDARPLTYWAPRGLGGKLELKLRKPGFVKRVGLLNARNRHQRGIGARSYVVELYSGAELVTEVTGEFDLRYDETPWIWREVDTSDVDKIVVRVAGASGHPAGLAEFRFE